MPAKVGEKDQKFLYESFHSEYENTGSVVSHASHLEAKRFSTKAYNLYKNTRTRQNVLNL